ncbi:MAG: hypothetical protein RIF39_13975 [Cyclobacteriaceae bacterium]
MCEDCFEDGYYRFETQKDFEQFEDELQNKCNSKKIEVVDMHKENSLSVFDSRLYYKCKSCDENWVMSIPDNAWRGYFLPEDKAIEYHEQLKKSDKKKALGCWVTLAIILAIIIWQILT